MNAIIVPCSTLEEANAKCIQFFAKDSKLQTLYIIEDTRFIDTELKDEVRFYVVDEPGDVRWFESVITVTRPEWKVPVSQAAPLIKAIAKRTGLTWSKNATQLIRLCNEAIYRCTSSAHHMSTRSGDNSEYLPNLLHYYTPHYIAKCIEKN